MYVYMYYDVKNTNIQNIYYLFLFSLLYFLVQLVSFEFKLSDE